jgi:radical SAM superfamily enzyme YgiQ (UPF0313 family)
MEECVKKHNIRNFFLKADTFTWDKKWVISVCQEIINRKLDIQWVSTTRTDKIDKERLDWMKKAGCWLLAFGIESGNQEILDKTKKMITIEQMLSGVRLCRKKGIKTLLHTLIGLPWDNKKTISDTIKFLKESGGDFFEIRYCLPYPGTVLEKMEREMGLLPSKITENYDYSGYIPRTLFLTENQVAKLRHKALFRVLFRPRFILKSIINASSPLVVLNYIVFGIKKVIKLKKEMDKY